MILFSILIASVLESLVSFFASLAVIVNEKRVRTFVHWVISFAVGVILGTVFFDILPEAGEFASYESLFPMVLVGFLIFFILEKALIWYHCHEDECTTHTTGYLVLLGDAVHNFIDGVIIALTFLADIRLGIITSFAVILHEIPQEVSDYTIMLHSGFSKRSALFYNVLLSFTTIIGALIGYFIGSGGNIIGYLLALVAGNFLYIAASDLIPELHHNHRSSSSVLQVVLVLLGIGAIILSGMVFGGVH